VNTGIVSEKTPTEQPRVPMPQMAFVACLRCGDPLASSTDRAAGRCAVCLANATAARAMRARAFGGGL
jgi:putative hemolysin